MCQITEMLLAYLQCYQVLWWHAEWYFRSSLDRYVWIHGMLFAYLHPSFEAALQRIDQMGLRLRVLIRSCIVAGEYSTQHCCDIPLLKDKMHITFHVLLSLKLTLFVGDNLGWEHRLLAVSVCPLGIYTCHCKFVSLVVAELCIM